MRRASRPKPEELLSKRHPNSPLAEVDFEIRFPGETAIECRRHEIQERIRDRYPRLLVPKVQEGEALAIQPYRFEASDENSGVIVALNRFGFYSRRYESYQSFKSECLQLLKVFLNVFSLRELNRVGLRYINILPFVRRDKVIPVADLFVLGEMVGQVAKGAFHHFSTAFTVATPGGLITTRIEPVRQQDGRGEALLLDFDYEKTKDLNVSRIGKHMDEAHSHLNDMFRRLVTESYRQYIEGRED